MKACAKRLIDVLGKNGGFIMGPNSAMDEADPDMLRVWFEFNRTYRV